MYFISEEKLKNLRELYKPGTKIKLIEMDDPQAPPSGTIGIVKGVDDIGQIMMKWPNGSSLSLIPDVDEFKIV